MVMSVAVIVGSLRKASFSRAIARAMAELAVPYDLKFNIVDISRLSLYNQDLEEGEAPQSWVEFRQQVMAADAVLFVTPEYNRSVPAVLKNALDIGSRPYGRSVWAGKPGAVVSVSPGGMGGFGANHHLRQTLVFLDVPTMQQPEMYLSHVAGLLDEAGRLTNPDTAKFLERFLDSFSQWIARNRRG